MPNEGLRVAASDPDHRAREPDLAWTMSALPPKADMARRHRYVRFVPIGDLSRCSKLSDLLDHLVAAGEQRRRHFEAQRLSVVRLMMRSNLVSCSKSAADGRGWSRSHHIFSSFRRGGRGRGGL